MITILRNSKAFTLIEVSIVIVVMGILIAAVLSAGNVIQTIEEQVAIKEVKEFEMGISFFMDKFKFYPGDFPHAADYWVAASGNGDWQVSNVEALQVANHLSVSHSVPGDYAGGGIILLNSNVAASAFEPGVLWFLTYDVTPIYDKTGESLDLAGYTDSSSVRNGLISAERAYRIDVKLDDGVPDTGYVYASNGLGVDAATNGCVDADMSASSANFVLNRQNETCRLHFWFDRVPERQ